MSKYGIVRKLDTLGRIVIPKEIRSILNIKEGEPLSINIDENNVIKLNKFSKFNRIVALSDLLCESIGNVLNCKVVLFTLNKIIGSNLDKKKVNKLIISEEILNKIINKENYIYNIKEKTTQQKIFENLDLSNYCQLLYPITYENKSVAGILLYSSIEDAVFTDCEIKICKIVSIFLSGLIV